MSARTSAVLVFLFAASAFAQNADLTLTVDADSRYNAGDRATIRVTVKNLGPDAATEAGVRLTRAPLSPSATTLQNDCVETADSVLCRVPLLEAGRSADFDVPFLPPDSPGLITLALQTCSSTADPDHSNDFANVTAEVVSMADLVATVSVYPGLQPGKESSLTARAANIAARTATNVRLSLTLPEELEVLAVPQNCSRTGLSNSWLCRVPELRYADGRGTVDLVVRPRPSSRGFVTLAASASSETEEWNPRDNSVSATYVVRLLPEVSVDLVVPQELDSANTAELQLEVSNPTSDTVVNPIVNVSVASTAAGFPEIVGWQSAAWDCKQTPAGTLECRALSLAPQTKTSIAAKVKFPAHEIRSAAFISVAQSPQAADFYVPPQFFQSDLVFYRNFDVVTSGDDGVGSLRQAIIDANDQCSATSAPPCRIRFLIPPPIPADGWFTISPASPLPVIVVTDFTIDGETQAGLTGSSNSNGPEIFIRGEAAGATDGLALRCDLCRVRGLAIGGFELNGIESRPRDRGHLYSTSRATIERNHLGVDPSGSHAVPNGLRGIMSTNVRGTISRNVISGNRRSGIWLQGGEDFTIRDNRIGIASAGDEPVPNGATGVFLLDTVPFTDVKLENNTIAYNLEYGVSSKNSRFSLLENVVAHNRIAVDVGLDGPSPGLAPVIESAAYDPAAGTTIIGEVEIRASDPSEVLSATVYLYANATIAEGGEEFVGTAVVEGGRFSLTVPRDLRGKYLDGTTHIVTRYEEITPRSSSEFGLPFRVSR